LADLIGGARRLRVRHRDDDALEGLHPRRHRVGGGEGGEAELDAALEPPVREVNGVGGVVVNLDVFRQFPRRVIHDLAQEHLIGPRTPGEREHGEKQSDRILPSDDK